MRTHKLLILTIFLLTSTTYSREPIIAELEQFASASDNKTAFDAAVARMSNHDTLIVNPGIYSINPVTVSGLAHINIQAEGASFIGTLVPGALITVQDGEEINASIGSISYTTRNWSTDATGLRLHGLKKAKIEVGSIINATRGVHFYVDATYQANQNITLRAFLIRDASKGISVQNTGSGWNNECGVKDTFIYLTAAVKSAESAGHCVHFDTAGIHPYDNWTFDRLACEVGFTGVEMQGGHGFEFRNCRFEDIDNEWYYNPGRSCKIALGVGGLPASKLWFSTNSDGLMIQGNNGTDYIGTVYDHEAGGITWVSPRDSSQKQTFFSNPNNQQPIKSYDYWGTFQIFNQSYQADAIPGNGTFAAGARVQNTNSACGQPIFWQCTLSGTMGTLDGVTGDAVSGSREVDLTFGGTSDIDDVRAPGTIITIGADVRVVQYIIDSDTIYLTAGVSTTHSGATVQYRNATWKAGPMMP